MHLAIANGRNEYLTVRNYILRFQIYFIEDIITQAYPVLVSTRVSYTSVEN